VSGRSSYFIRTSSFKEQLLQKQFQIDAKIGERGVKGLRGIGAGDV